MFNVTKFSTRLPLVAVIALLVMIAMGSTAWGQLTGGNLVVVQMGDGVTALSGSSAPVFLKEYTTSGSLVQSITVNASGASPRLTLTGTSTSEGHIVRSSDGNYLTITGYDVVAGTATGFVSAATPRIVGRINSAGTVDLTTAFTDGNAGGSNSCYR